MHFENVYWDESSLGMAHKAASILAIGDSWFWYPFPGGSLLNALGPLVKERQHTVYAVGQNGAEAYDYVHGAYKNQVDLALRRHGDGLTAVFISGGGNDFAGYNDLRPLLGANCSQAGNEAECFLGEDGEDLLQAFMEKTRDHLGMLIGLILSRVNDDVEIYLHNYDYAVPSGRGVLGSSWLKPALDAARVPPHLYNKCMARLVDRFTDVLQDLTRIDQNRVVFIDTRGALDEGDWANELHPSPTGFRKIAARWQPTLRTRGLTI